jgi:hypothetical protein
MTITDGKEGIVLTLPIDEPLDGTYSSEALKKIK